MTTAASFENANKIRYLNNVLLSVKTFHFTRNTSNNGWTIQKLEKFPPQFVNNVQCSRMLCSVILMAMKSSHFQSWISISKPFTTNLCVWIAVKCWPLVVFQVGSWYNNNNKYVYKFNWFDFHEKFIQIIMEKSRGIL